MLRECRQWAGTAPAHCSLPLPATSGNEISSAFCFSLMRRTCLSAAYFFGPASLFGPVHVLRGRRASFPWCVVAPIIKQFSSAAACAAPPTWSHVGLKMVVVMLIVAQARTQQAHLGAARGARSEYNVRHESCYVDANGNATIARSQCHCQFNQCCFIEIVPCAIVTTMACNFVKNIL